MSAVLIIGHYTVMMMVMMMTLQLQWLHVSAAARSYTLSLDDGVAYYSLAFGISAEQLLAGRNRTTSSGITWVDCVYVYDAGARVLM